MKKIINSMLKTQKQSILFIMSFATGAVISSCNRLPLLLRLLSAAQGFWGGSEALCAVHEGGEGVDPVLRQETQRTPEE